MVDRSDSKEFPRNTPHTEEMRRPHQEITPGTAGGAYKVRARSRPAPGSTLPSGRTAPQVQGMTAPHFGLSRSRSNRLSRPPGPQNFNLRPLAPQDHGQ